MSNASALICHLNSTAAMNENASRSPQANRSAPTPRLTTIWWTLLALLLVWNFAGILFRPSEPSVATVPYSVFVQQVKQNNVGVVRIVGSRIGGTFRRPVHWPPAAPSPSVKPDSPAAPPPGPSTGQPQPHRKEKTPVTGERLREPPAGWPFAAEQTLEPADYEAFVTTFPETVGDPQLLPLLEEHGVQVNAERPAKPWLFTLLINVLPFALLMGYFWWMGRRAMNQQSSIFGIRKSGVKRFDSHRTTVSFRDVAGADAAKHQLQEEVDFLRHPEKYHALGARIPRGVLLVGPPGTGKTLLARAVAGEAGAPFFSINGSEFVEMFVGVGASRVRDVFRQAKETSPAILFIDELDAVGRRRGAGLGMVNDEREQTLNQLLVEMDGFDVSEKVIVVAATNRPDVLDPALLRPGRFDRQIVVDLPEAAGREEILRIHTRSIQIAADVDLRILASITTGMSGAQLASLCNEAALIAAGKGRDRVHQADFESALDKLRLGDVRALVLDEHTRQVIACHESGHALVAWLTPGADTVHKVTIVPHGQSLGVTEQRPGADQYNFPKSYLLARLAVLLGGRAAEELVIGDITTGAENDLIEATRLARHMVMSWGMSDLGLAAHQDSSPNRFLGYELARQPAFSEHTAARIDREVQRLLTQQHERVTALLRRERDKLERLAARLLDQEIINHAQLIDLLGPRPEPTRVAAGGAHDHPDKPPVAACHDIGLMPHARPLASPSDRH
jgi:cell division protease FtsH